MKTSFFILFLFVITNSIAQEIILPPNHIKSIQLSTTQSNAFMPIIPLNGTINLSFDDLEADEKDYYYKIEHCDKHWKTSDLVSTEFIRGYDEEQIRDYNNSFNTTQDYTHYNLRIPNKDTKLLISGNYRISVLDEDDETIFTRYFIVYEPICAIGISVHQSRDIQHIDTQQSVQFSINHPNFIINNPYDEIYPILVQNNDFSTQITGLKPQFIRGEQLLYKYDKETAFWGGNEFLNFDTKDIRYTNMSIAKVVNGTDFYHTHLFLDRDRSNEAYTYYPDINGNFVIRNVNSTASTIESDYSQVHFTLDVYEQIHEKEVYVYGNFNNYQLVEENKMLFNENTGHYELTMLLKQGFYNYTYITLDSDDKINTTELNGSHDETENEYSILVYYSKFGSYYDRVIGYGKGSSLKILQ